MTGDLISRSALMDAMGHRQGCKCSCADCEKINCLMGEVIEDAPAVEAEPVVHAHWVMRGGRRYCSACGTMACVTRDREDFWYTVGTKRCPECGAHMDEEVADV